MTQQAVGKWESGKSSPDPATVARIAETETVKEGNVFTRLWQRIVNLFKF